MDTNLTPPTVAETQTAANGQPPTEELSPETLREFDAVAPPATQETPANVPSAEAPTVTPPTATPAATETKPTPETPVADKPAAETPAQPPADAAPTPPAADPNRIEVKAGQKVVIEGGVELEPGQIQFLVDAWNKGNTADRAAADKFKSVFGMDAEQTEQVWGPVVKQLTENARAGGQLPQITQGVIDAVAELGPTAENYLATCLRNLEAYKQGNPGVTAPAKPAVDAETRARIEHLERQSQAQALAAAKEYTDRERAALTAQYPVLALPDAWETFATKALAVATRDPNYTLTRCAQDNAALLQIMQRGYDAQRAAAPPAPTPAQGVPALVHSNGAAPVVRSQAASDEVKFDSLDSDDVINEYLRTHPEPLA